MIQLSTSEMYLACTLQPNSRTRIGRQILPVEVTHEKWEARGSPVREGPYDVHAVSVHLYGDLEEGTSPQGEVRSIWSVHINNPDGREEEPFKLDRIPR